MSKKTNIMSLSIDPEVQEKLKKVAARRDISVSKLIRDLSDKFLNEDESMDMVVLRIPKDLKNNPDDLIKWMNIKSTGIVAALIK